MKTASRILTFLACLVLNVGLAACAGFMPVPGGGAQVNEQAYKSQQDFVTRVGTLHTGMPLAQVLSVLNRPESDLIRLNRPDIMAALYGGPNSGFDGTYEQQERARAFLQTISGYKLLYVDTHKDHGFSSPIRLKTHETGYSYVLTLIFQNGKLFDQPILSGGAVNAYSSKTIFDYFSPSAVFNLH